MNIARGATTDHFQAGDEAEECKSEPAPRGQQPAAARKDRSEQLHELISPRRGPNSKCVTPFAASDGGDIVHSIAPIGTDCRGKIELCRVSFKSNWNPNNSRRKESEITARLVEQIGSFYS